MIDYHLHTRFSKDGKETIEDICLEARKKGLKHIAITDHLDYDESFEENWEIKTKGKEGYIAQIADAREKFPDISITKGVEAGYTPTGQQDVIDAIKEIRPDFVIGSLHFIKGVDPYEKRFFEGKTKKQAYEYYFEKLLEAIKPLSEYSNVIGHITYVSKSPNVPFDDVKAHYCDYKKYFDDILTQIVKSGLGIEINTSGLLRNVGELLPHFEIVKRYKELGGEILTIGSDAHLKEHVGTGIQTAIDVAKEAGFEYITIFPSGKQSHIKI
jgi:histidinol-phosphatase (PHP family)